jgi:stalled ribosome rescue protein Dom34
MFENRVLRKTFEHKTDEITGEWRRLHSEELHDLYFSTNIIKKDEIGEASNTFRGEESFIKCMNGET